MKKGLWVIFSLMIIYMSIIVIAAGPGPAPLLVCGQNPSSVTGYGEVQIGVSYFPCNNRADGICPEDYQDYLNPLIFGNCSNCLDPDCTGSITGNVNTVGTPARPIEEAIVTVHPIRWDMGADSMEKSTLSDNNGKYRIDSVVAGTYYVSAAKAGYDTELKIVTINKGLETFEDYYLPNGTCHADCTNSYGRCNALCQDLDFDGDTCHFDSDATMLACHNRMKGTSVFLSDPDSTDNTALFVDCCEGSPVEKYYVQSSINTSILKNVAIADKVVRYDDMPVKIVVAYWTK